MEGKMKMKPKLGELSTIQEEAKCENGRVPKETLSVELVKYCYGDRGIAGSSLVHLRKCLEEEYILREVFGGSVSSFVKIQRRCCFISCGFKRGNLFVRAEDDIAPEDDASAEEDEDIPMTHPTNVAGPSHPPQEYSLESISRQIADMASMQQSRMDDMMAYHALRYDEIDNHLKEIDNKLAKLYVPDSDDEP
ncbi:hypothetical protein LR48_Vigan09g101800 [Vigna angularis]|uniref:Uncharacterized protein n=1 Tax=Phaseolus angularis TaxID=3914 RepID=A0A0L9VCH7_PHAAN|nr:hypothetical protein LR48_Vigan09g101800 [Vigna angularis]